MSENTANIKIELDITEAKKKLEELKEVAKDFNAFETASNIGIGGGKYGLSPLYTLFGSQQKQIDDLKNQVQELKSQSETKSEPFVINISAVDAEKVAKYIQDNGEAIATALRKQGALGNGQYR